ncbi:autotransporter assembly complex family protein [Marinicella sp. W31]|uniref:autotransporter assembly complex protein TamA n=1 Tax=Marinicella sp. W31 TaxID=3023713 RepID=UPI003757C2F0
MLRKFHILLLLIVPAWGWTQDSNASAESIRVDIQGLEGELLENARNHLTAALPSCQTTQWKLNRYAKQATLRIEKSLQAMGYYTPQIRYQTAVQDACAELVYQVEPGPATVFRDIDIQVQGAGSEYDSLMELVGRLPLVEGERLRHDNYSRSKDALLSTAISGGFLDSYFIKSSLDIYSQKQVVDVELLLDTGQQYRLGEISFEQSKTVLQEQLLHKLIQPQLDGIYSQELLSEMRQSLSIADYYKRIDFVTSVDKQAHRVNVHIQLQPGAKYEYTVGGGVSTDEGPRLRLGYDNYRVNTKGDRYAIDGTFSGVSQELTFVYQRLGHDPGKQSWDYSIGLRREEIDAGESTTASIGAAYSKRTDNGWNNTTSLEWLYEDFSEQGRDETTLLLIPGYSWSFSRSDRPFYTSKGLRTSMTLKGADQQLLSDASFVSLTADLKWIRSLNARSRIILRGGIGAIATSDFDELPLSLKYFAGGDSSIRGYSYKSVGPEDSNGRLVGGRFLAELSSEFEYRVYGDWGAAVFMDAGDAFSDDFDLKRGVGIGVRWYSPVGPIRIDIGHGLDDPENNIQLHFSLGQDI